MDHKTRKTNLFINLKWLHVIFMYNLFRSIEENTYIFLVLKQFN